MAPTTLEIASSIIYPVATGLNDAAISINITPPSVHTYQPPPPSLPTLPTGPNHPLYRLPQSLSSGGLKVHLNTYTPPSNSKRDAAVNRANAFSSIDEEHIIFEIAKASIGDAAASYTLTHFGAEGDGYGRGEVRFTPGWISGGVWDVGYVFKRPGHAQESRVDLQCDDGGAQSGVWRMTFPMAGVVARETMRVAGGTEQGEVVSENGRGIEIAEGAPGLEGWSEGDWRDFLAACFCAKVWRECTRTKWFGASARKGETGGLGRW
ncbi:hypothetical protein EDC01DRAFT_660139 [Geopyxis carbonaria]|nr:hypothetical protein EDC01DRAFT_660139 [Geopyxis carbonaria]